MNQKTEFWLGKNDKMAINIAREINAKVTELNLILKLSEKK